jgi:uncharacterized protein YdaU (DUF1376 family)
MPLYWGDLLADTLHLTRGEFGAYLLLMGAYWRKGGPLPDDDTYLRNVARYEPREWPRARNILASFFTVTGGTWTHKRIDRELALARENKERQRLRTANATAARTKKPHVTNLVTTDVTTTPPPSPSPDKREREIGALRKPASLDECLAMAQRIGVTEPDARDWYRDCEAAEWRRGDGTLFDNWPRQLAIHRDKLRETRARTGGKPASTAAPNTTAETILRQTELKRVEERMRVIRAGYSEHQTWDDQDRAEFKTLKARKKELHRLARHAV